MAHAVFISYAANDARVADAVCSTLESRGIGCWMAPRDILPGKYFAEAIIDAINETQIMVLVFSASANSSTQVLREIERAASKDIPIVTFRVEDVPPTKSLEYFISSHHWLDAANRPLEESLKRLADAVERLVQPREDLPYTEAIEDAVPAAVPTPAGKPAPAEAAPQPETIAKAAIITRAETNTHPIRFWLGLLVFIGGIAMLTLIPLVIICGDDFHNADTSLSLAAFFTLLGIFLVWLSGRGIRNRWFWPGMVMFIYGLGSLPVWLNSFKLPGFPHDSGQLILALFLFSIPFIIVGAFCLWRGWPRLGVRRPRGEAYGFIFGLIAVSLAFTIIVLTTHGGLPRDILSFSDDFEDGAADGWNLKSGWAVVLDDASYVLEGEGFGSARPNVTWTQDYVLEADFKLLSGFFDFSVRYSGYSQTHRHYIVWIDESKLRLGKFDRGEHLILESTQAEIGFGQWHTVRIMLNGSNIRVYVDDKLKISYWDTDPPPAGGFEVRSHPDSVVRVDNISVQPYP